MYIVHYVPENNSFLTGVCVCLCPFWEEPAILSSRRYRHHPFNFVPISPFRRNVRDLVNQSHDKKMVRLRMQAITQTADDGMHIIQYLR